MFRVGDRVVWKNATLGLAHENNAGTVVNVIPHEKQLDEFALYDVDFDFGTRTLYGTQLVAAAPESNN